MADFLILAIRGRMNMIVSGGTGAGKTTLLNCMSRFIPDSQRVVTIEETAELSLQQTDVIPLETRLPNLEGKGAVTQRDLLRNALRMRPDRIIVGESRGGEVLDMLQAMNTGHDGSMSTVHTGERRVTRISEVSGLKDGEYRMDDIFVYRMNGEDKDGRPTGSFFATGYQPVALRRLALTGANIEQYLPLFEARELKMTAT